MSAAIARTSLPTFLAALNRGASARRGTRGARRVDVALKPHDDAGVALERPQLGRESAATPRATFAGSAMTNLSQLHI